MVALRLGACVREESQMVTRRPFDGIQATGQRDRLTSDKRTRDGPGQTKFTVMRRHLVKNFLMKYIYDDDDNDCDDVDDDA